MQKWTVHFSHVVCLSGWGGEWNLNEKEISLSSILHCQHPLRLLKPKISIYLAMILVHLWFPVSFSARKFCLQTSLGQTLQETRIGWYRPADKTKHLAANSAESQYGLSLKCCNWNLSCVPQGWRVKVNTEQELPLCLPHQSQALHWCAHHSQSPWILNFQLCLWCQLSEHGVLYNTSRPWVYLQFHLQNMHTFTSGWQR